MKKDDIFLSSNIKYLRTSNQKTQKDIGDLCGKTDTAVSNWEKGIREPDTIDLANIANYFNITVDELMLKDLRFDNASLVELDNECTQIPVLGTIKAGIAIEAQQDILEYIDIPKSWLRGGKSFYGLKISGDSMYPKYNENDIVIFERTEDYSTANNKDCAVMVNGYDATFKTVAITNSGITLIPYNPNNQDNYQPTFYNKDDIEQLPVKIIGIAREKRTRL